MAVGQIYNVNIITHTRTVRRGIIITKYRQIRQLARGNLTNIWQKIIGNAVGMLANQAAFMGANRIEIAQ